jgi:butyryl-CoA dehydrogenase
MQLTDDQKQIAALARDFARGEIAPYAAQWDRDASFPMTTIKKMAEVGLLGMTAPERFGGSDADTVALVAAVEEIARADASCALVLSMANSLSVLSLMTFGTPEQQVQWLPQIANGECIACFTLTEPHAGSNPTAMKAVAERKGDRYVLRGTKQFISLGSVSRLAFVFALTDPAAGAKGISCFLVPPTRKVFASYVRRTSSECARQTPARSPSTTSRSRPHRCSARPATAIASRCMD